MNDGEFEQGLEALALSLDMEKSPYGNGWSYNLPSDRGRGWIIQMSPSPGLFCISAWFTLNRSSAYTTAYNRPFLWLWSVSSGSISITQSGKKARLLKPMNQVVSVVKKPLTVRFAAQELICFSGIFLYEDYAHQLLAGQHTLPELLASHTQDWSEQQINTPDLTLALDELKWSVRKASVPLPYYHFKTGEILMLVLRNLEHAWMLNPNRRQHVTWENRQIIDKIKEVIDRDIPQPPSVPQLAALAAMSESMLSRLFKSVYGITIASYIREAKLKKAMMMMARDELSIKEIAKACGYTCAARFTAAFKEVHNITPSQYRKAFNL